MTVPDLPGFDPADSTTWHPQNWPIVNALREAAGLLHIPLGTFLAPGAEHIARQLYPTPPAGDPPGPPWVLVLRLPDNTTPAEAITRDVAAALPDGTRAWALAAGPARTVLGTLPEQT